MRTSQSMRGKALSERMDRLTDKSKDCWSWLGARTPFGHGLIKIAGRNRYAHRVALFSSQRADVLSAGGVVRHTCDNPSCVNPGHLALGTQQENIHDAISKGRFTQHMTFNRYTRACQRRAVHTQARTEQNTCAPFEDR